MGKDQKLDHIKRDYRNNDFGLSRLSEEARAAFFSRSGDVTVYIGAVPDPRPVFRKEATRQAALREAGTVDFTSFSR